MNFHKCVLWRYLMQKCIHLLRYVPQTMSYSSLHFPAFGLLLMFQNICSHPNSQKSLIWYCQLLFSENTARSCACHNHSLDPVNCVERPYTCITRGWFESLCGKPERAISVGMKLRCNDVDIPHEAMHGACFSFNCTWHSNIPVVRAMRESCAILCEICKKLFELLVS